MINQLMALNEDDAPEQLELSSTSTDDATQLEARRERLLRAVNSSVIQTSLYKFDFGRTSNQTALAAAKYPSLIIIA
jgi:hypothetical protein